MTLPQLAQKHLLAIRMQRHLLWLSWRGPVSAGQLVARIGA
jgi:hypothetical protein